MSRQFAAAVIDELSGGDELTADEIIFELLADLEAGDTAFPVGAAGLEAGAGRARRAPTAPAEYEGLVERAMQTLRQTLSRLHPEGEITPGEALRQLLALRPEERWQAVSQRGAWHRPEVVTALLSYLRHGAYEDHQRSDDLARLAVELIEGLDPRVVPASLRRDLAAEAWSVLAREVLATGSLASADVTLRHAESLLAMGSGDLLAAIQVQRVRMLWHWARGEASAVQQQLEGLLGRAALVESASDEQELWLWLAVLLDETGRPGPAHGARARAADCDAPLAVPAVLKRVLALQARLGLHGLAREQS